jgi:dTDP-4-dehydro-6-deoxy-alpha-D-glucopyranose 2,3-dehydratase
MNNYQAAFLQSCLRSDLAVHDISYILDWIRKKNEEVTVLVKQVAFSQLVNWSVHPETGNITHQSGKFFSIEGLQIHANADRVSTWSQPIINQPEVGYLGFIVKKINGVMHFLIQAKIEPGNVNCVQLSPTIQATRSNYMRVHSGNAPKYLDYFKNKKGRILIDQLQSEQGARFYRKRNRNIILEIDDDVVVDPDFIWITLGQIKELLKIDNIVNMDTRTVISSIDLGTINLLLPSAIQEFSVAGNDFSRAVIDSFSGRQEPYHQMTDLLSWLTELKSIYELRVNLINLNQVEHWKHDDYRIYHEGSRYFEVIGVDVTISNREVSKWTQPIVKPCQDGIAAFITKMINGQLHFLMQAKIEIGNLDIVELAPTVQCITGSYLEGMAEYEVPYLREIINATPDQIQYDVMLSEEGGRFYKNQNRNLIILLEDNFQLQEFDRYRWMTLNQIMQFMKFNNYINIEARSLISILSI